MFCEFCNFYSEDKIVFKKHLLRVACKYSRLFLFVCKCCNFICHNFNELKTHSCKNMHFEYNELEKLRNSQHNCAISTVARIEWKLMHDNFKILQDIFPDFKSECLNDKKFLLECKNRNISVYTIYSLIRQLKWLNPTCPDLGNFNLRSILDLKKKQNIELFFDFSVNRKIDIRHYFKLLISKAECIFWPFLITNETIIEKIFKSKFAPIKLFNDGSIIILQTKDVLKHALFDTVVYSNWVWLKISRDDAYRLIFSEWIEPMFKNIIIILESIPNLLNIHYCNIDTEGEKILKKITLLFPFLITFLKYWNCETCINSEIIELDETIECTTFDTNIIEFENLVKKYSLKGMHRGWEPLIRLIQH